VQRSSALVNTWVRGMQPPDARGSGEKCLKSGINATIRPVRRAEPMTTNATGVNSDPTAYWQAAGQAASQKAAVAQQNPNQPQDSVQLSPTASAAAAKTSGDVDHDGDRH